MRSRLGQRTPFSEKKEVFNKKSPDLIQSDLFVFDLASLFLEQALLDTNLTIGKHAKKKRMVP